MKPLQEEAMVDAAGNATSGVAKNLQKTGGEHSVLQMQLKGQDHHYDIHIGPQALSQLPLLLGARRCAIVTDDVVWALHGKTLCGALGLSRVVMSQLEGWKPVSDETLHLPQAQDEGSIQLLSVSVVPNGEASKNMDQLSRLYKDFVKGGLTRRDMVIAFGGGVIGDLAGYVAATWLRGVDFIQVPTSLLAMVDSSVGGKVAIDLPEGKNLVGAFHQPKAVLVDPRFLDTLPRRQLRDGIAEMVKAAMIRDEALLPMILEQFSDLSGASAAASEIDSEMASEIASEMVSQTTPAADVASRQNKSQTTLSISSMPEINKLLKRAINIKKIVVESDEKEIGDRKLLNFGHTLGHAAESRVGYNPELMTHGEGVAFGMQWITRISEKKGLSEPGTSALLESALAQLGFEIAPLLDFSSLKNWVLRDKKMTEKGLEVILIRKAGEGYVYSLAAGDVDDFFNK
ncbi:3-dehydroquinate synthase [Acidaminobacter hydrogenoformans]|uniref:3-dehydroquinate synthase n=1 Tax=Acidaminobacter hydrogenoformans DSM 2784 TaxID=1120920 RepID=A0A1G5S8S5_9FIRM|nr:3-dehydroquinate synthase [Acidaminobacter hydrogenoformans]SCZ82019.1 3-dehydroquinate synthase [Acidaminobacter hydrogenoformans DSM 2784]